MNQTLLAKSFGKAELTHLLRITEEQAHALLYSQKASLTVSQLAKLKPQFKSRPRPEPLLRKGVSKFRLKPGLPASLAPLVVTVSHKDFEKVKLSWEGKTATFVLNAPRDSTMKGILEDIFTFVDLLEPGRRVNSRMKNTFLMSHVYKKARRDLQMLQKIFGEELDRFRTLALEDKRSLEQIYGPVEVNSVVQQHKLRPKSPYTFEEYSGSPIDFIKLLESVDLLYEIEEDDFTESVKYFTFLGDLIGAERENKRYVVYYNGVHPIDRAYEIASTKADAFPLFCDSEVNTKPTLKISVGAGIYYNAHSKFYIPGSLTIRGAVTTVVGAKTLKVIT